MKERKLIERLKTKYADVLHGTEMQESYPATCKIILKELHSKSYWTQITIGVFYDIQLYLNEGDATLHPSEYFED